MPRRSIRNEKDKPQPPQPLQIDRLRETYIETIARDRKRNTRPPALLDTAHKLLTAHWGPATWAGRASILKSVDWLLQIGNAKARTLHTCKSDSTMGLATGTPRRGGRGRMPASR